MDISPLLIVTASSAVQFDGKIFIQIKSSPIEGDLHVRTNDNFMRIGKSTSGLLLVDQKIYQDLPSLRW